MIVKKTRGGMCVSEVRWERVAAILISVLAGTVSVYLLFRYAFPLFLPFLLAFAVSALIRPVANKLAGRTRLSRGLCAVLLRLLVFGLGGWGLWLGSVRLLSELANLVERLLSEGGMLDAMDAIKGWIDKMGSRFPLFLRVR